MGTVNKYFRKYVASVENCVDEGLFSAFKNKKQY